MNEIILGPSPIHLQINFPPDAKADFANYSSALLKRIAQLQDQFNKSKKGINVL